VGTSCSIPLYLYKQAKYSGLTRVMKAKTLGAIITMVQIVSFIALVTSLHTLISVLGTTLPTGRQVIRPQMGDPVVIPFTFHPRNGGLLEATLTVTLSMMADVDNVLATDSVAVTIPAGRDTQLDLELIIPLDQYQDALNDPDLMSWEVEVNVVTLFNLISYRNVMTIPGGA